MKISIFNYHNFTLIMTLSAFSLLYVNHATGQLELEVKGLKDPIYGGHGWVMSAAHKGVVDRLDILLGDPVGFKIILRNNGKEATKPFRMNLNLNTPSFLLLTHPDGKYFAFGLWDERASSLVKRRSMQAGQQIDGDFIVHRRLGITNPQITYLFPVPGKYILRIIYFTGLYTVRPPRLEINKNDGLLKTPLEKIREYEGYLISNPLEINVGDPFPGWSMLIPEIMFYYEVGSKIFDILADRVGGIDNLKELVIKADRPWLKDWYAKENPEARKAREEKKRAAAEEAARQEAERQERTKEMLPRIIAEREKRIQDHKDRVAKAETGDFQAQVMVASYLAIRKKYDEAEAWYKRMAEEHGADGMAQTGQFYLKYGRNGKPDHNEALNWFTKSYEQGSGKGAYWMGESYLNGWGVEKNEMKAIEYFREGAKRDNQRCMETLSACYLKGVGVEKDEIKASEWRNKSSEITKAQAAAREAAQKAQE